MTVSFARVAQTLVAVCALGCAPSRDLVIVHEVTVHFDEPFDASPLSGPSARLTSAAREVRDLLGHPLVIEIDASLAPEFRDEFSAWLTDAFEHLAQALTRVRESDAIALQVARESLRRVVIRYAPETSPAIPSLDGRARAPSS